MRRADGFTLIELIIVIVIMGILAAGTARFISFLVGGYVDTARRQTLTDSGTIALEKLARELGSALPNSVRITGSGERCIEFIPILAASSYLTSLVTVSGGVYQARTSFSALPAINRTAHTGRIAINGLDTDTLYAPVSPGPISTVNATLAAPATGSDVTTVTFAGGGSHAFASDSSNRRFYVVDTPVAYCQQGSYLWRYAGYGFSAVLANPPSASATHRRLVLGKLVTNSFIPAYETRTAQRNAVVNLGFTLQDARAPTETVPLNQQVRIRNVP